MYPNFVAILKIILKLPITIASDAERSLSRLKIIKNYLRSSISQERFTSLAILSIEYRLARKLNDEGVIIKFSIKHYSKQKNYVSSYVVEFLLGTVRSVIVFL